MSAIKLAATALLAAAFLTQASVAAMAEDNNSDDDSTSFVTPTTRPLNPAPNERRNHGDRPKHKEGEQFQVAVPPMVITPDKDTDDEAGEANGNAGNPKQAFKVSPPKNGSSVTNSVPDTAGNQQVIEPNSAVFDPTANKPIEMQNIHPNKKTPADVFIESAQIGVGAMAAGAAVLGITAAVRGSRFRRQAKTDFIYEVEAKE
jgi:hypothetical protein